MREHWLGAYDYVTPRGSIFLSEYARASDPFANIGDKTVSVQVTSVVRASDTSFQVKWTESAYERGSLAGTSRWTAILTIAVKPPRTAETLRKNPLGLYVDAIDWSRELETPAPVPAEQQAPTPAPTPTGPAATESSGVNVPAASPLDPSLTVPKQPKPEIRP
jgi:type IV secretion system protein VirB5